MIIVTGASRGLGRAIATRLQSTGHEILGLARSVEGLPFPAMCCDVANMLEIKTVVRKLRSDKAHVKALINVAGIASMNLAVTTPPEMVARLINVNLLGTIYCCQSFAPFMLRHKAGCIINFSTIAVPLGLKGESVYVASKAGVEAFSRTFAREVADFNVRVNCIAPGPINTELLRGVTKAQIDRIVERQILKRQFEPDDVADLVELLIDPKSNSLSGQTFNVGGV